MMRFQTTVGIDQGRGARQQHFLAEGVDGGLVGDFENRFPALFMCKESGLAR